MPTSLNMEFRDMAREACYPFTAESLLTGDVNGLPLTLPRYFVLDAILYPVLQAVPPFHLYTVSGVTDDAMSLKMTFRDSALRDVGSCVCLPGSDVAMVRDANNIIIGTVVYSADGFDEVRGKLENFTAYFGATAAVLATGRGFRPQVDGGLLMKTPVGDFTGDITIAAAAGIHFDLIGDVVEIDLYGELRSLQMPIKTINGIPFLHAWLMAHPGPTNPPPLIPSPTCDIEGSDLRVGTTDYIKIGKARDFTYAE